MPLVDDLGSGAMVRRGRRAHARREPVARAPTSSASPATSSSAGRRPGSSSGRADLVERLRRHPLQRALRADKLTLAALEGTLASTLDPSGRGEIAVLRMLDEPVEEVRARAERLAALVGGEVEETVARVGGGALPLAELPSFACAVEEELGTAARRRPAGDRGRPRRPDAARLAQSRRRARRVAEPSPPRGAVTARTGSRRRCGSRVFRAPRARLVPLIVGTAGHIDHGKTSLVRALTGIDTDRLPEEKRRGISIDLGFAPLGPRGRAASLVDVPGHERFVQNMLAGATGIDLVLLVIAADEGVMPQTREHLAIVDLLGIEPGVVALTKADRRRRGSSSSPSSARGAAAAVRAGAVVVSARTGAGLDELRAALARVGRPRCPRVGGRAPRGSRRPRLHRRGVRHRRHRHALVWRDWGRETCSESSRPAVTSGCGRSGA